MQKVIDEGTPHVIAKDGSRVFLNTRDCDADEASAKLIDKVVSQMSNTPDSMIVEINTRTGRTQDGYWMGEYIAIASFGEWTDPGSRYLPSRNPTENDEKMTFGVWTREIFWLMRKYGNVRVMIHTDGKNPERYSLYGEAYDFENRWIPF